MASAKFWLENIALALSAGFSARQLGEIQRLVQEHQPQLWHPPLIFALGKFLLARTA